MGRAIKLKSRAAAAQPYSHALQRLYDQLRISFYVHEVTILVQLSKFHMKSPTGMPKLFFPMNPANRRGRIKSSWRDRSILVILGVSDHGLFSVAGLEPMATPHEIVAYWKNDKFEGYMGRIRVAFTPSLCASRFSWTGVALISSAIMRSVGFPSH
jgi:hypothetical protein